MLAVGCCRYCYYFKNSFEAILFASLMENDVVCSYSQSNLCACNLIIPVNSIECTYSNRVKLLACFSTCKIIESVSSILRLQSI